MTIPFLWGNCDHNKEVTIPFGTVTIPFMGELSVAISVGLL